MARWKIICAHYLNCADSTEWEYKEIDKKTGRERRHKMPVPRFIDPGDPGDWTRTWGARGNEDGEVIVCLPGKGEDGDIEFHGDPTPDMIPVDAEAEAITKSFAGKWETKPEAIGQFSQSLIDKFQIEMAEAQNKPQQVAGMAELTAAISAMAESNAELVKSLVSRRI